MTDKYIIFRCNIQQCIQRCATSAKVTLKQTKTAKCSTVSQFNLALATHLSSMNKQLLRPLSVPDFVSQLWTICESYDTEADSSEKYTVCNQRHFTITRRMVALSVIEHGRISTATDDRSGLRLEGSTFWSHYTPCSRWTDCGMPSPLQHQPSLRRFLISPRSQHGVIPTWQR